jgi:TPR repeat protein
MNAPEISPASTKASTRFGRLFVLSIIAGCLVVGLFVAAPRFLDKTTPALHPPEPAPDVSNLKIKAESGDVIAQYELGKAFAKGLGVTQDYKAAAKYYRLAVEQGNAAAQTALGELCEAGRGTTHDDAEAARWYRAAAETRYAPAQYNLAVLYVMGRGVNQDEAEALKWYRKAAVQGDELAQYNLGMRFLEGKGVKPDMVESFVWLSLAKAHGLSDAGRALEQLKPRMSGAQMTEAKRRLAEFQDPKAAKP